MKKQSKKPLQCDGVLPLNFMPSGKSFYSSGFSPRSTSSSVLKCFAAVPPLTLKSEVPLGDYEEGMQVMDFFMSSTLEKVTDSWIKLQKL